MHAGDLNERVAFEAPARVADDAGGSAETWSEHHRCWAHFQYLRGSEAVQAARLQGRQPVVVTVRQNPATEAVGTEYRLRDLRTGTIYNVRTNTPAQDDPAWRELLCESGVAV